ncbi:MAG: hypothetical protein R6W78_06325 [Bacteroidales bacterium]
MDKDQKKNIAYSIAKAGLGLIPIAGAAASELLQLLVTPPLEKRREKWMEEIGNKIRNLESNHQVDLESLQNNQIFLDVVLQTTQQALKTSQKEKLDYYKNAILNTAIGEHPEISEIQIFLNLISDYTVWHVKILKLFDNPTDWFKRYSLSTPNFISADLSSVLEIAFPELKDKRDFCNLIWDDLHRSGLHNSGNLQAMISGSGLMVSRTSEFGKKFLRFITDKSYN